MAHRHILSSLDAKLYRMLSLRCIRRQLISKMAATGDKTRNISSTAENPLSRFRTTPTTTIIESYLKITFSVGGGNKFRGIWFGFNARATGSWIKSIMAKNFYQFETFTLNIGCHCLMFGWVFLSFFVSLSFEWFSPFSIDSTAPSTATKVFAVNCAISLIDLNRPIFCLALLFSSTQVDERQKKTIARLKKFRSVVANLPSPTWNRNEFFVMLLMAITGARFSGFRVLLFRLLAFKLKVILKSNILFLLFRSSQRQAFQPFTFFSTSTIVFFRCRS